MFGYSFHAASDEASTYELPKYIRIALIISEKPPGRNLACVFMTAMPFCRPIYMRIQLVDMCYYPEANIVV